MNKPLYFSTSVDSPPLVAILPGLEIIASVRLGEDPMNLWLLWQQLLGDIRPYLTHTYDNLSTQLTPIKETEFHEVRRAFELAGYGPTHHDRIYWASKYFVDIAEPDKIANYSCACSIGWINSPHEERGFSLRLTVPHHYPWSKLVQQGIELTKLSLPSWRWITIGYRFALTPWPSHLLQQAFGVLDGCSKRFLTVDVGDYFGLLTSYWQKHLRTVGYITLVSSHLLDKIGIQLTEGTSESLFQVFPVENGLMFQVGDKPILGDVNRRENVSGYQAINQLFKPIRVEDNIALLPWNLERTQAWLRRFEEV